MFTAYYGVQRLAIPFANFVHYFSRAGDSAQGAEATDEWRDSLDEWASMGTILATRVAKEFPEEACSNPVFASAFRRAVLPAQLQAQALANDASPVGIADLDGYSLTALREFGASLDSTRLQGLIDATYRIQGQHIFPGDEKLLAAVPGAGYLIHPMVGDWIRSQALSTWAYSQALNHLSVSMGGAPGPEHLLTRGVRAGVFRYLADNAIARTASLERMVRSLVQVNAIDTGVTGDAWGVTGAGRAASLSTGVKSRASSRSGSSGSRSSGASRSRGSSRPSGSRPSSSRGSKQPSSSNAKQSECEIDPGNAVWPRPIASAVNTTDDQGRQILQVTWDYHVKIHFNGSNCAPCEYRQKVAGHFKRQEVSGGPLQTFPHRLFAYPYSGRTVTLHDRFFEEDSVSPEDYNKGDPGPHYGHREQVGDENRDNYYSPDRATGCWYEGLDTPGWHVLKGMQYDFLVKFLAYAVRNGEQITPDQTWRVAKSGTA